MSALFGLAWRSLRNRRFTALLSLATIAVSVMLLLGVERVRAQARTSFLRSVSGVDLVVGARTGSIQLLLASVFRVGDVTQSVSWGTYQRYASDPRVAWTVPIALGDSHRGYRVLGTTPAYFERLRYAGGESLRLAQGRVFNGVYETVLGADVARALGYSLGQSITLAHGTAEFNLHSHDDQPFTVIGILAPTGTPIDQTVHVSLTAIEALHVHWRSGTRIGDAPSKDELSSLDLSPTVISAFFVGVKQKVMSFGLQRQINEDRDEALSAIMPAVALQELWRVLGMVERALLLTASCVVLAGLLGMLTALLATLNERRREMAILRAVGAGPGTIFALLVTEAGALAFVGSVLGLMLTYALIALAGPWLATRYGVWIALSWPSATEWLLLAGVLASGLVAGMLPAWLAYRRSLADGLILRI